MDDLCLLDIILFYLNTKNKGLEYNHTVCVAYIDKNEDKVPEHTGGISSKSDSFCMDLVIMKYVLVLSLIHI